MIKQTSMRIIYGILFFFYLCQNVYSQNYFQQDVKYTINVTLNDKKHLLTGSEDIYYKNNSTTILNELYFHLYPNAYKNNSTTLAKELYNNGDNIFLESENKDLGYIDSLEFKVNGISAEWNLLQDTIDICRIKLPKPLQPGDSIHITTPFKVKIPNHRLSRLGHNAQAYFITQWFPKPAVFDKNGWNYFSYLDKGEYYSEFGSFDVTITLPENYVVAATGELVNGESEIVWLENKAKETMAMSDFPKELDIPTSSATMKTLRYKQDSIHDFAWFADKRWHVLKGEVELPISKRKVTTWSFFTNAEAEMWRKAPEYISNGILYMSNWVGEYPYSTCTVVDVTYASGSGMEYPMVATIGSYGDPFELDVTIVHEVIHNWFYGIIGSNERKHPWMDEGICNFYETRYIYTEYASDKSKQLNNVYSYGRFKKLLNLEKINHKDIQYQRYLAGARRHTSVSPDDYAQNFSRANYGGAVYYKTTISTDYLKEYLGDSLFDRCMKRFYEKWKFKHPDPVDMKNEFEIESGQKLDWYFNDLVRSDKYIDYSICSIKKENGNAKLTLSNKGEIAGPLWISKMKDGIIKSTEKIDGFSGTKKIEMAFEDGSSYKIDANKEIPELDRKNNTIKSSGLFKKTEKLNLQFLSALEDPDRTQLFYIPVIGYNVYNSFMGGIAFHNVSFHEKPFEFAVMPMYATKTQDLAGGADFRYHFYLKNSAIKKITIQETIGHYAYADDEYVNGTTGETYSNTLKFTKADTRFIFTFKNPHPQKKITKEFEIRNVLVNRDIAYFYDYKPQTVLFNYVKAEYRRINSNALDASSQKIAAEYDVDHFKANLEFKQFFCYGKENKGVHTRFFLGYLHLNEQNVNPDVDYRYILSGTPGNRDYLYDDIFIGRTEETGLFSRQFIRNDAGFTTPTLFYRKASEWMVGLNASTTLPGFIPFRLYVNIGTFNDSDLPAGTVETSGVSWELGVELPLVKEVLTVYFPFAYSNDIQYINEQQGLNFGDLIRFELHLQKLNPLNYIRTTLR